MPGRAAFDAMPLVILALTAAAHRGVFALKATRHFILALVALTTVVGVGLNVLLGLAGQVSLGHVGFYAIGAYAAAILTLKGLSFWLALPLAGAIAGVVGAAAGAAGAARDRPLPRDGHHRIRLHRGARHDRMARPDRRAERPDGHRRRRRSAARRSPSARWRCWRCCCAGASLYVFHRLARSAWGKAHGGGARCRDRRALDRPQPGHRQDRGVRALGGVHRPCRRDVRAAADVRRAHSFPFSQSILFLLAVIVGGAGWALGPVVGAVVTRGPAGAAVVPRRIPAPVLRRPAAGGAVARAGRRASARSRAICGARSARRATRAASIWRRSCTPTARARPLTVDGIGIAFGGIRAATDVSFRAPRRAGSPA